MLDIFEELKSITKLLISKNINYALCGGLAMAVYGKTRATVDIDLLILSESLDEVLESVRELGYTIKAQPTTFAGGSVEIRRISKLDPDAGDLLALDLLLVTSAIKNAWDTRIQMRWDDGIISVVSRDGLISLKSLRKSGQDLDDIKQLSESDEG